MRIISKKQALDLGLSHYYTGDPCKNGHLSRRSTATGHCLSCCNAASKRWAKNNQTKLKEYRASIGPEKHREWQQRYKDKDPERLRKIKKNIGRKYRERHPDRHYKSLKKWRSKNPEKLRAQWVRRHAIKKGSSSHFSSDRIVQLVEEQSGSCVYCKVELGDNYHVDHIMPFCLGGDNSDENIQLCCPSCNLSKGGKDPNEWAKSKGYK